MKVVCISDTHGYHEQVDIPKGDILIHAGDFTKFGKEQEVADFALWMAAQPHKHRIVIPGNHDWFAESHPSETDVKFDQVGIKFLIDELIEVEGLKVYGSPYTPEFFNWAFMYPRTVAGDIRWMKVPPVDILVTHGPPYQVLDKTKSGDNAGCQGLLHEIGRIRPKLHVFGHIHEGYGKVALGDTKGSTLYVNASICTLKYKPTNKAIVVDI